MSTNIICECFGILLIDAEQSHVKLDIANLVMDISRYLGMDPEAENYDIYEVISYIIRNNIGNYIYNGNGQEAVFLGFEINSWDPWDLRGDQGLIDSIKKGHTTEEFSMYTSDWNNMWADNPHVKEIIDKHNIKPDFFWTSGSS